MTGWKRLALFTVCLLLIFGAANVRAKEASGQNTVTVADDAGILMEEEADWLKSIAQGFSDKSGFDVVVATCKDAGGKSAQEICEENYNRYADAEDGISCLVDLDNRELYLATAGNAQRYLTDDRLDQILEDAYAAAKQEDYTQALYLMLCESDQAYTKGVPEHVEIVEGENTPELMGRLAALVIAIVAGGGIIRAAVKRRPSGGQAALGQSTYRRRYYRRPPRPVAPRSSRSSVHRSSVHTGAGGRRFGGRGRKF